MERTERYAYQLVLAVLISAAAMLGLTAKAAEAQEAAGPAGGASTDAVLVESGETLWSISAERLGPGASPQQIALQAEQTYALNRARIGADPDLIFPGQELIVAGPVTGPTAAGPAAPTRETTRAQAGPGDRATGSQAAPRSDNTAGRPTGASASAGEPAPPSEAPDVASGRAPSPPADEAVRGRRSLGWAILSLTLAVAVLMVWRLPMNRGTLDAEAWFAKRRAHLLASPARERDEDQRRGLGNASPRVLAHEHAARGRARARRRSGPPQSVLQGASDREVRRALLRARTARRIQEDAPPTPRIRPRRWPGTTRSRRRAPLAGAGGRFKGQRNGWWRR